MAAKVLLGRQAKQHKGSLCQRCKQPKQAPQPGQQGGDDKGADLSGRGSSSSSGGLSGASRGCVGPAIGTPMSWQEFQSNTMAYL